MTETTLVYLGIACILCAIFGGGLKALGQEFPPLQSVTRQVLLAASGLALIVVGTYGKQMPFVNKKCADLNGWWHGEQNNLVIPISQSGCEIVTNFSCGTDQYSVSGVWNDNEGLFDVTVTKTTPQATCRYNVEVYADRDGVGYHTYENNPINHCGFGSEKISKLNYTRQLQPTKIDNNTTICVEGQPSR